MQLQIPHRPSKHEIVDVDSATKIKDDAIRIGDSHVANEGEEPGEWRDRRPDDTIRESVQFKVDLKSWRDMLRLALCHDGSGPLVIP